MRFNNPNETLKPNMYTNVKIFGGPKNNTIVIPLEGLIRTGREERVIISLGDGKFEAKKVRAGIESGNFVEILEGVNENDLIVTSGQFLIDSEASMRASINRMESPAKSNMSTMKSKITVTSGSGVIKKIIADENKLNMFHDPIDALGWPAMTMDFIVTDDIQIEDLSVDDKVIFQLEQNNDRYRITSIRKTNKDGL